MYIVFIDASYIAIAILHMKLYCNVIINTKINSYVSSYVCIATIRSYICSYATCMCTTVCCRSQHTFKYSFACVVHVMNLLYTYKEQLDYTFNQHDMAMIRS